MGYVPLFDHLTTGTLHGKWPDIGLWPVVLSMADRFGEIDVTPAYIAGVTGLPVDEVAACMERFCEPDPYSRTSDHEGRRLELIDNNRKWGWRVLNHSKYREKARLLSKNAQQTASGMDAERKRKEREAAKCPPLSAGVRPSDEDGDLNKDSGKEREGAFAPPPKPPNGGKPSRPVATRIPEYFCLSAERQEYAESKLPRVNAVALFEEFSDYWRALPGQKALKLDWDATWRTWVRRSADKYPMINGAAVQPEKVIRYDSRGRVRNDI